MYNYIYYIVYKIYIAYILYKRCYGEKYNEKIDQGKDLWKVKESTTLHRALG